MKKISIVAGILLIGFVIYFFTGTEELDVLDGGSFLVIAHRGASAHASEHTMESYRLAQEMNADYIEIDLQMTGDGVLVAFHDSSVDRTTDGSGKVAEMDLADLKKLDAGSWFNRENPAKAKDEFIGSKIPTLQEVFEEFGDDVNYYIETKQPDKSIEMEKQLIDLLDRFELLDPSLPKGKVVIQSFSADSLKTL